MQELLFGWAGWDGASLRVPDVSFLWQKESITFKRMKISHYLTLNTKARYKRKGALGTSGSFVNQPSWHTELQNSLSCSQCKALTRCAFLGKTLIYLNSLNYFIVYCLYCRNTSRQKCNASVSNLLMQQLFCLVTQRHLFPVGEKARCVMRPNNGCERDYAYCRSSNRKKIKIICLQFVAWII